MIEDAQIQEIETEQIIKELDLSLKAPEVSSLGPGEIEVKWPLRGYYFTFQGLRENGSGLKGELEVRSATEGRLHWGAVIPASLSGQESLIKKLASKLPIDKKDWSSIVEKSLYLAAKTFRTGAPAVLLKESACTAIPYAINPILQKNSTAIIFGDGGSAKSFFSLFLAVATKTGCDLPQGITAPEKGNVLLTDWEASEEEVAIRVTQICRGLGIPFQEIPYLHMTRALADDLDRVRKEIATHNASLLIVDSLAPACGGDPEFADSSIRVMNALRSLPTSNLVVAHVNAAAAKGSGPARP